MHRYIERVRRDERDVGETLSEPPHQIRIPVGTKRHVDPHVERLTPQLVLQVPAHTVQHLELISGRWDRVPRSEALGMCNDLSIVRRDAGIISPFEQPLHAADEIRIDVLLLRKGYV